MAKSWPWDKHIANKNQKDSIDLTFSLEMKEPFEYNKI